MHECANAFCRGGCEVNETLEDVLFSCPIYLKDSTRNAQTCDRLGIDFSIKNFLSRNELLPLAEQLFRG